MKTILLIAFLILCDELDSQMVSLSFSPSDNGIGARYDSWRGNNGAYLLASLGNYRLMNNCNVQHFKLESGYTRYVSYFRKVRNTFSGGVSYSFYDPKYNGKVWSPVSFCIGTGIIVKRYNIGFDYDFLKNEAQVHFGVKIRYRLLKTTCRQLLTTGRN